MDKKDQDRQDVDRLIRRAEELGHDPRRVARALDHAPLPQAEKQPTMKLTERQSWFGVRVARRIPGRSAPPGD